MDRIRTFKMLQQVRERRTVVMQEAVDDAMARRDEAGALKRAAERAVAEALSAEALERHRLADLTSAGQSFDIGTLLLREHVAATRKSEVVFKQQDVERCDGTLNQRVDELRARRGELARHRQKIDALAGDIARLEATRQQEDDDRQDEEAEEAAVSRLRAARSDELGRAAAP